MKMSKPSTQKLLMVGSSGHASVLVDAIELAAQFEFVGYVDDTVERGAIRRGRPILGAFADVARICAQQLIEHVVIAIGDNWSRRKIYFDFVRACPSLNFPSIKHPSAFVSSSAQIGRGSVVLAGAHVGPNSRIGEFCILNTGSSLDHDCTLQDFASIAPGVFTGGLVEIGECSAVGVGASISDRISIGRHTVVGTGAVVVRNIPDLVVAYGSPARVKRTRTEGEKYLG
jgi:sugar O-acyltransferase (sialic acid O-acetyltransferase NeuD family)